MTGHNWEKLGMFDLCRLSTWWFLGSSLSLAEYPKYIAGVCNLGTLAFRMYTRQHFIAFTKFSESLNFSPNFSPSSSPNTLGNLYMRSPVGTELILAWCGSLYQNSEELNEKNWCDIGLQFHEQSFESKISNRLFTIKPCLKHLQEAKFTFHISSPWPRVR